MPLTGVLRPTTDLERAATRTLRPGNEIEVLIDSLTRLGRSREFRWQDSRSSAF